MMTALHRCRSRSNHRCCYNAMFHEKPSKIQSSSSETTSSSSTSKKRVISTSSERSSGYGCSHTTQRKRPKHSPHIYHPNAYDQTGTCKAARVTVARLVPSRGHRSDSIDDNGRPLVHKNGRDAPPGRERSHQTRHQRSGNEIRSRGYSTVRRPCNGRQRSAKRSKAYSRQKHERKEAKRRAEKARRKDSHEGHKRKPASSIVSVGDLIKRRYSVQAVLGEGSFGQVFQCFDLCTNELTAVKAIKPHKNYKAEAQHELDVLDYINKHDRKGHSHCLTSSNFFEWHENYFLVCPLLGPSVFNFLEENNYEPYPIEHVASIMFQLCESIEFLHKIGIVHTDLKPENILFVDGTYDVTIDPKSGKSIRRLRETAIKVIDFGSAILPGDRHSLTIQTRHYRAPEVILELGWNCSADIWSLGCMLFEMVTGQCLFMTHDSLEHLAMMERLLGPMPKSMARASKRRRYFRNGRLDWPVESSSARHVRKSLMPLGDYWFSFSDLYTRLAIDLTKDMLEYHPDDRITCSKSLKHPFLLSFDN